MRSSALFTETKNVGIQSHDNGVCTDFYFRGLFKIVQRPNNSRPRQALTVLFKIKNNNVEANTSVAK